MFSLFKKPLVFLFIYCLIFRLVYTFLILSPEKYFEALPKANQVRAEQLANNKSVAYAQAWSSYYLIPGLYFKALKVLGLYENRMKWLVFLNVFLGSLCVVIFYAIARKIFSSDLSLILGFILAFYYPLIYLGSLNLSENVFVFTMILAIYFLLKSTLKHNIIAGLFLGVSFVCRPIILPFLLLVPIWVLSGPHKINLSRKIINLVFLYLPVLLVIILTSIINYRVSSPKSYSIGTSGGVNFAMNWCELKRMGYKFNDEEFWFAPPALWKSNNPVLQTNIPFRNESYYYKTGFICILKKPQILLTNTWHAVNVFNSMIYPDFLETNTLHKVQFAFWNALGVVLFLFFVSYPLMEKNRQKKRIYQLFFLLFLSLLLSVYAGNPGEVRYLAPYFFVLLLFGGGGIALVAEAIRGSD